MARLILGLMSGTSVDGIDAALVRVTGRGQYRAEVVAHTEQAWPARLRKRLLAAMAPAETTTQEICTLNVLVAEQFAAAALKCLRAAGVKPGDVDAIGSHGQTLCHLPPESTLQVGSVSTIAALTGIRTVGDFRLADMAFGGQGAPLVPFADACLLRHKTLTRCVQNIGGIANVTFLPAWGRGEVIAFDTGPGNMAMDAIVRRTSGARFDKGGRMAARGTLDVRLLKTLQKMAYFKAPPPKSTGRELFGEKFVAGLRGRGDDLVHTLTRLTAWSIADAYQRFLPSWPDEVIPCGGGAYNDTLVGMLAEELAARGPAPRVRMIDDFGIANKAKEAASFAILAAATLDGIAGNVPSVTGASQPCVLGVVASPSL